MSYSLSFEKLLRKHAGTIYNQLLYKLMYKWTHYLNCWVFFEFQKYIYPLHVLFVDFLIIADNEETDSKSDKSAPSKSVQTFYLFSSFRDIYTYIHSISPIIFQVHFCNLLYYGSCPSIYLLIFSIF